MVYKVINLLTKSPLTLQVSEGPGLRLLSNDFIISSVHTVRTRKKPKSKLHEAAVAKGFRGSALAGFPKPFWKVLRRNLKEYVRHGGQQNYKACRATRGDGGAVKMFNLLNSKSPKP